MGEDGGHDEPLPDRRQRLHGRTSSQRMRLFLQSAQAAATRLRGVSRLVKRTGGGILVLKGESNGLLLAFGLQFIPDIRQFRDHDLQR